MSAVLGCICWVYEYTTAALVVAFLLLAYLHTHVRYDTSAMRSSYTTDETSRGQTEGTTDE